MEGDPMDEVKNIVKSAFSKLANKKHSELTEVNQIIAVLKKSKSEIDVCSASPLDLITALNKTIENHEKYAKYLTEWDILAVGINLSLSCCWINKFTPVFDINKAIIFCDELIDLELNDKSNKKVGKKETKCLNTLRNLRDKLYKLQKIQTDIDETKI
jgi:hypothetical protein